MITDEQIRDAYLRQYEKGVLKKEVRSYEVSIWTLQDEFVTVLKWSDVEQKGRIEHPKMILSDDSIYEFSFSIPMYYDRGDGILIENPLWYNTRNGNIMINMRKVKVIFNKATDNERVFDFVITMMTEQHEGDKLTCEIKSEDLAFHELGKTGYKYDLSLEEFDLDYKKWEESNDPNKGSAPKQNVQYWCNKIGLLPYPTMGEAIDANQWYYKINMDWTSYPYNTERLNNIVYEEGYISAWDTNMKPTEVQQYQEKERTVEVSESNKYNITQKIAETFNIFCRYEYVYDVNYHIVGRNIIFFNSGVHDYNALSITYPYSSNKVSRELDSTDLTTKMYVRTMEDDTTLLGEANISYCKANKSLEDYILNFDYMKESGGINDEQFEAVKKFENKVRKINLQLIPLVDKIAAYEAKKIELEAKIKVYTESIALDTEQINKNSALKQELISRYDNPETDGEYLDVYNAKHPATSVIIQDDKGCYYINLKSQKKGIQINTLRIHRNYNVTNHILSNEILDYSVTYDEYGIPEKIYGISPASGSALVYMTYEYDPQLYYDAIVETWEEKRYNDQVALDENKLILENVDNQGNPIHPYGLTTLLKNAYDLQSELLAQKEELLNDFQKLMGPALREGYWQPEDYQDYGEHYSTTKTFNSAKFANLVNDTGDDCVLIWDDELFDGEQKLYYESSVKRTEIPYPCINISSIYTQLKNLTADYDNVYVMYNNDYTQNPVDATAAFSDIKNIRTFGIGSGAVYGFVKSNDIVYPALILVGAKTLSDNELDRLRSDAGYISIGVLISELSNNTIITSVGQRIQITNDSYWTFGNDNCWTTSNDKNIMNPNFVTMSTSVLPRIKFSSLMLKTADDQLSIKYNGTDLLTKYEDYYINNRIDNFIDSQGEEDGYVYTPAYFITIKPSVFARNANYKGSIDINYVLSNACTAIYLDALEIAKENSQPKVSYTVTPSILDESIISTLYNKLYQLVMINDVQLKFSNAFGYISKLELDLDAPWNDTIEVKNYKNKFEDLFSSIVAETEELKRNNNLVGSIASGGYVLSSNGLKTTLENNNQDMLDYLAEHFLTSEEMKDFLSNILFEVSEILSGANSVISDTQTLTIENTSILSDFAMQVEENMVPHIYKQAGCPTSFKKGDIWIEVKWDSQNLTEVEIGRYVATSDSNNSLPGYGWTKTYNGSLATLAGPNIDIDPLHGTIELKGDTAKIIGNKSVEIGGVDVNIGSVSDLSTDYGGINLVATGYDTQNFEGAVAAKVIIKPTKISMFSNEIDMLSGSASGGSVGTSAVKISGQNGIWIGSSAGVKLFSGSANLDSPGGANIELMPTYLLMGVSSGNSGTAIKMDSGALTLAAGASGITNIETSGISGVTGGLTGMRITKDFFGLAMIASSTMNAIIMNQYGITLASGMSGVNSAGTADLSSASGSYVRISGEGIKLNSQARLDVNTTNVVINSTATGSNTLFRLGTSASPALTYTPSGGLSVTGALTATSLSVGSGDNMLTYNNGVLTVKGNMTVTSGKIGGWDISGARLYSGATTSYVALDGGTSGVDYAIWCGNSSPSDANFAVKRDGTVYMKRLIVDNQVVNFTQAFNKAAAFTLSCSGTSITARVKMWNNDSLTKDEAASATASISSVTTSGATIANGVGTANITVNTNGHGSLTFSNVTVDASAISNGAVGDAISRVNQILKSADVSGNVVTYITGVAWSGNSISSNVTKTATVTVDLRMTRSGRTVYATAYAKIGSTSVDTETDNITVPSDAGGGASTCFVAGTLIKLNNNTSIPIEQLTVGKELIAYNEENSDFGIAEIRAVQMFKHATNIYDIILSSGNTLTLTSSHPILTTQGWKAVDPLLAIREHFIHVSVLVEGDQVITENGTEVYVEDIVERVDLQNETVYNIDVEPFDTYIAEGIVVHNADNKEA